MNSIIVFALINMFGVLGTFLLTALTGHLSFGQASFMSIGAYVSGLLALKWGLPFPISLLGGLIAAAMSALLIGLPTLKLHKYFFALITFGFGTAVAALLNHFTNITGGAMGLSNIPCKTNFLLVVISIIITIGLIRNFVKSNYGRMCIALRNDEIASEAIGINVYKTKLLVFVLSAIITSYGGVLYGSFVTYVEPGMFGWTKSTEWVIYVFVGGVNSLTGAVVAGFILNILPELLRFVSNWRIFIYSLFILIIFNFRPEGLFGEYEISFSMFNNVYKNLFSKLNHRN